MAEFRDIIKRIDRHKDLDYNLPSYVNEMMDMFYNLAGIKLSLNYYTMKDILAEDKGCDPFVAENFSRLEALLCDMLENGVTDRLKLYEKIYEIRTQAVARMEVVSAYTDNFKIYEYILNRIEARFSGEEFDKDYYYNNFKNDILKYIFTEKEGSNLRLDEIMCELPIRITKSRFYEKIMGAFSLYRDSDRAAFDELLYMIRSESTLSKPEGFDEVAEFKEVLDKLKEFDFKDITEKDYNAAKDLLEGITGKVGSYSDDIYRFVEIINDIIILLLTSHYATRIDSNVRHLLECIVSVIHGDAGINVMEEYFVQIEGIQESIYEYISAGEHIIDDYTGEDILETLCLKTQFNDLRVCDRLSKGSTFAALTSQKSEEMSDAYIARTFEVLVQDFEKLFEGKSSLFRRAVMAAVMSHTPKFKDFSEVEAYIDTVLSSCSDNAERIGCMNIIRNIIDDKS